MTGAERRVLVAEDNLFFRAKLEAALREGGFTPVVTASEEAFIEQLVTGPVAVLLSAGSSRLAWEDLSRRAREVLPAGVPLVAYGPHVDESLGARARRVGCDLFVPNGAISRRAAEIVGKRLGTSPDPPSAADS